MPATQVFDSVLLTITDGVARIELNRPEASNAFDMNLGRGFADAVSAVAADTDVRSVLICGRGRFFCPGGDVASMAAAADPSQYLFDLASAVHPAVLTLSELSVPVVAAVQGAAAGAGLSLTLVADIVIAGPSARFLTAYGSIGLSPDCGLSWLLPQVVGLRRALELNLTGRKLTAAEAVEWGLATAVIDDDDDVLEEATRMARKLANGPASAHGSTRHLLRSWSSRSFADQLDAEVRSISAMAATPEAGLRISSFASASTSG
jgi:2-(1,2-epoxy-1,2-dihydrophenyl)acetyl-CoA isomerase